MGRSWGLLGPILGVLGRSWGDLGASWGRSWGLLGRPGSSRTVRLTALHSNKTGGSAVRARRRGLPSTLLSKLLQYLHLQQVLKKSFSVIYNTLPVAAQGGRILTACGLMPPAPQSSGSRFPMFCCLGVHWASWLAPGWSWGSMFCSLGG